MAWYDSNWDYRVKVTVASAEVDADLTDFPVYVDLSDLPAGFFSHVKSDGGDIRVTKTDGTTEVPREVVAISTGSSTGELHFKASGTLSSSSDTDFYIYYGNSGASEPATTATYGRDNVWSDYAAVYHMNEDPSGSSPQMVDSTGNGYDGTSAGFMTSGDLITGQVGKGLDMDGSNDEINIGTTPHFSNATAMTWSLWANSPTGVRSFIAKGTNSSPFEGINMFVNSGRFIMSLVPSTGTGGQIYRQSATTAYSDSAVRFYAATYAGDNAASSINLYANGANVDGSAVGTWSGSQVTTRNLKIGERDGGINFLGLEDEIRLRFSVLTSTWISTEYSNQNAPSSFYTAGSEESNPSASTEHPAIFFGFNF